VIKAVAEMADWKKPRGKDRALGIAFSDYHESFSAGIAEVSLDRKTGRIKVHNYWIAGDAGIIVQPENAHAQLEGAVVYGLGSALTEELTYKDGAVQQSNFHDYRLIRMSDMPQIHTKVIVTDNAPTGLGELGVPDRWRRRSATQVFKLTGKRLRQLPMSASRVSADPEGLGSPATKKGGPRPTLFISCFFLFVARVDLDIGVADDVAVRLCSARREHPHLVGRHGRRRLETEVLHACAHFRRLHALGDLGGELRWISFGVPGDAAYRSTRRCRSRECRPAFASGGASGKAELPAAAERPSSFSRPERTCGEVDAAVSSV
jgi:hypothetical protein